MRSLKRWGLTVMGIGAMVTAGALPARAQTYEGHILAGQPTTGFVGGIDELAHPCDSADDGSGIDGVWFDISGTAGSAAELTMDPTLDADVYFYTSDCSYIDDWGMAEAFIGEAETGTVPAGAAFAVVDGFIGSGSFQLTIG